MDFSLDITKRIKDNRGSLVEVMRVHDIEKYASSFGHIFYVTFDFPEVIRGNHYHKKQHEFYVLISGKICVVMEDVKTKKRKELILDADKNEVERLRVGPNIAHALYNISPKAVLLSYYSNPYNEHDNDTFHYTVHPQL